MDFLLKLIEEFTSKPSEITSPQTAYLITSMLEGVVQNGTGTAAKELGRPVAGKTGTTNDQHDAWFIGYTPDLLAGVWVGYDDHRPLGRDATGGRVAAPIWVDFMKDAIRDKAATAFAMPEGIRCVMIDSATGLRAREDDWDAPLECFREGTEPQAFAPMWQPEPALARKRWSPTARRRRAARSRARCCRPTPWLRRLSARRHRLPNRLRLLRIRRCGLPAREGNRCYRRRDYFWFSQHSSNTTFREWYSQCLYSPFLCRRESRWL